MTEGFETSTKELQSQFSWFDSTFNSAIQNASDDFLLGGISFKLVSLSRNMNALFQEDSYFVTRIKVDSQNEIYIRCSDKAVNTILERALGQSKKTFKINSITELEAKLITAYNDNLFNFISENFQTNYNQEKGFDIIHLTFIIKDEKSNLSGKVIFSIPSSIIAPQSVISEGEKFSNNFFQKSFVDVDILIGSTTFTVKDLTMLEPEDIVVLDNSNIQTMRLNFKGFQKDFRITPNPSLIISVDSSEGEEAMDSNTAPANLWDSIQVEMGAEFDKVKISLGELKNIENGLVVDIGSVYNNNVTLKVEEKPIATGELVIVNDRYGIKINQVFAEPQKNEQEQMPQEQIGEPLENPEMMAENQEMPPQEGAIQDENGDGDFDYSDFELEDEDI